jgi:hypothetical protein
VRNCLPIVRAISLVGFLAGCATSPTLDDGTTPTVPLQGVINSLKCGLARALSEDRQGYAGLYGAKAEVVLQVNLVKDVTTGGSLSAGIPVFQGAATITPSLGFSNDNSRTYNTTINFNFDLSTHNDAICRETGIVYNDGGFGQWLSSVVTQIYNSVAGPPRSSIEKYVYETDFVILQKGNAGLDVSTQIVPIKASASYASSRQDVQHMTITIGAVHLVNGKPDTGARPHYVPGARPHYIK